MPTDDAETPDAGGQAAVLRLVSSFVCGHTDCDHEDTYRCSGWAYAKDAVIESGLLGLVERLLAGWSPAWQDDGRLFWEKRGQFWTGNVEHADPRHKELLDAVAAARVEP